MPLDIDAALSGGSAPAPSGGGLDINAALTQPKQQESSAQYVGDRLRAGAANLLSLPVEAVGGALKGLHIVDQGTKFAGGKEQIDKLLNVRGVKAPTDPYGHTSKSVEYMGTVAEFLGGAILPGAGAVATAERKLATAVTTALGAMASGTSAVEGKELGQRLAPTFGLPPERGAQLGEFFGGFAGPMAITKAAQYLLKGFNYAAAGAHEVGITGTSREAQTAAANRLLVKDITEALTHAPQSESNVARAIQLKQKVERFSPNIAQMTNAPGLVAMYKEVANKSPESLAKAAEAERKNLEAIAAHRDKAFGKPSQVSAVPGQPTKSPLTDPARIKLETDRSVLQMGLERTQRELRRLSDAFRRSVDNEAVGNELREKYWAARGVAKAGVTKLYEGPGGVYQTAKKYGIKDDMTDVRDAVNKIVGADRTTFQNMPPTFSKILHEYPHDVPAKQVRKAVMMPGMKEPMYRTEVVPGKPGKHDASFEEMHSLYKQANKDWADATVAGDSTKAHYMAMVRDMLQQKISKFNDPKYGELSQKFTAANEAHAKYAHVFREGAGGEMARRGKNGELRDSEDIVAKTILRAGDKKKGVQDFFELYGNDPRAAELLHDGLLDNFSKAAVKDGVFDPKAARRWLDAHHSAMSELPDTAKYFEDATKMGDTLVNRRLELRMQRQALDRSVLAKVAGNEQPEKLIQRAIDDPKLMRGILEGAYTQESKQAIARAIADNVAKRSDGFEFLKAHEQSLKPVMEHLGKGHWDNLMDLAEMEKIAGRTKAPTEVELGKLQDVGEKTIGTSVKGMFSRLRNLDKPMGVSKEYLIMDVGGRFFYKIRSEELARLREDAMFNPDTAEVLAKLGMKSKYTKKELLNLQAISFAAGVNSLAQGTANAGEGQGE